MSTMPFSMGILWRRSIRHNRRACEIPIICIMFVVYTRLFMGSNKLYGLGTRCSAPSYLGSTLSHPVQTRPSLFTPEVMRSSISWFMLTILLLQVVTPPLSTIIFENLTLNSPQRILGCCLSSVELRFWPLRRVFYYLSKSMLLIF